MSKVVWQQVDSTVFSDSFFGMTKADAVPPPPLLFIFVNGPVIA